MEITLIDQLSTFFFAVIFGTFLGIILDIFKIFIIIFKPNSKTTFWRDIIYFCFIAVLSFLFIIAVNIGEIRAYILAGELLGWLVYRFTLGKVVIKKADLGINYLKKLFKKILSVIPKPKKCKFLIIKRYRKKCSTFLFCIFKKIRCR